MLASALHGALPCMAQPLLAVRLSGLFLYVVIPPPFTLSSRSGPQRGICFSFAFSFHHPETLRSRGISRRTFVVTDGVRAFVFADRVRIAAALRRLKDIAAPRRSKQVRGGRRTSRHAYHDGCLPSLRPCVVIPKRSSARDLLFLPVRHPFFYLSSRTNVRDLLFLRSPPITSHSPLFCPPSTPEHS